MMDGLRCCLTIAALNNGHYFSVWFVKIHKTFFFNCENEKTINMKSKMLFKNHFSRILEITLIF